MTLVLYKVYGEAGEVAQDENGNWFFLKYLDELVTEYSYREAGLHWVRVRWWNFKIRKKIGP